MSPLGEHEKHWAENLWIIIVDGQDFRAVFVDYICLRMLI